LLSFLPSVIRGGGELNWPMPALVFALPVLCAELVNRGGPLRRAISIAAMAGAIATGVILIHVVHPFLPIEARRDTTLRGAGFAELTRTVREAAERHRARAIVTRRYQLASMLRYHLDDAIPVVEIGSPRRSEYDLWAKPPLCAGDAAIILMPGPALPEELELAPIDGASPVEIERRYGGQVLDSYFLTPVRVTKDLLARDARCADKKARDVATGRASGPGGGRT
jgi:hypothetical protein